LYILQGTVALTTQTSPHDWIQEREHIRFPGRDAQVNEAVSLLAVWPTEAIQKQPAVLEMLKLAERPLVYHITRVNRGCGFKQENVDLFLCARPMLDASRNHNQFARPQPGLVIAKLHSQAAT
jgi:hypothetical protein